MQPLTILAPQIYANFKSEFCIFNSPHLFLRGRLVSGETGELGEGGDEEGELWGREGGEEGGAEICRQATQNARQSVHLLSCQLWSEGGRERGREKEEEQEKLSIQPSIVYTYLYHLFLSLCNFCNGEYFMPPKFSSVFKITHFLGKTHTIIVNSLLYIIHIYPCELIQ